jgi:hypothetical protein
MSSPIISSPILQPNLLAQADPQFIPQTQESVIDRIPASAAAAMVDSGSGNFLIQILYAAVIIWIVSLMRVTK